jgi:hypothetical protein
LASEESRLLLVLVAKKAVITVAVEGTDTENATVTDTDMVIIRIIAKSTNKQRLRARAPPTKLRSHSTTDQAAVRSWLARRR